MSQGLVKVPGSWFSPSFSEIVAIETDFALSAKGVWNDQGLGVGPAL